MTTCAWLVTYSYHGEKHHSAYSHNPIADFRAIDPEATVQVIDCLAVARLVAAARKFDRLISGKAIRDPITIHTVQVPAMDFFELQEALASIGGAQ
jgi:acetyl-CoA acetyltransferase